MRRCSPQCDCEQRFARSTERILRKYLGFCDLRESPQDRRGPTGFHVRSDGVNYLINDICLVLTAPFTCRR